MPEHVILVLGFMMRRAEFLWRGVRLPALVALVCLAPTPSYLLGTLQRVVRLCERLLGSDQQKGTQRERPT